MKHYIMAHILILSTFFVSACFHQQQLSNLQFSQETWPQNIQENDEGWAEKASRWFFRDVNKDRDNFLLDNINFRTIPVYNFNSLFIKGNFNIQITGNVKQNYVMVQASPRAMKAMSIKTINQTLYLEQTIPTFDIKTVIIRVGINDLHHLIYQGTGSVEGTQIDSHDLSIKAIGPGNIFLKGKIGLKEVMQQGNGVISIFGANAQQLNIFGAGDGEIGMIGRVGLHAIISHGSKVNIIGAQASNLSIIADHSSQISIQGRINLHEIRVKEQAAVYVDAVQSHHLQVYGNGNSEIGLKGRVNNLSVHLSDQAKFYGRDLIAKHVFIRTANQAHANVNALAKIYAAASHQSSIYFFGSNNVLFSTPTDEAVILTLSDSSLMPDTFMKPFF